MRDVSNFQGDIDIAARFPDAVAIACKATEGTGFISPSFQNQWRQLRHAHKERIAYHFFHPSVSPLAQARFFLDTVMNAGLENGDILVCDHEQSDGMAANDVAAAAEEFVDIVNAETKGNMWVYTFLDFARAGNCTGLGKSPLWIADPSSPAGHPEIPEPWSTFIAHQWGIVRGVDDDALNIHVVEELTPYGVLVNAPAPTDNEILFRITSADQIKERIVPRNSLIAGFVAEVGQARFEIL
jgi:GH25 family lysozyme M1 (1,4-beta-N-acetylmuramidase)